MKSAPKNTVVPQEVVNVMAMLKTLHGPQQIEIESTVSPTGPPAAANGGALPPAAPTPWQELLKEYSSDEQLRQSIRAAEQSLLGRRDEHADTTTSTLSTLDLSLNQARKLFGHLMNEDQQLQKIPTLWSYLP